MNAERPSAQQLNALVDGELDLVRQLDLESRLESDAGLRAEASALRTLSQSVRARADYHTAPAALRERLTGRAAGKAPNLRPRLGRWWTSWRPLATSFGFVALFGWAITATLLRPSHDDRLLQEAVGSHVRASLANRVIDVASSDRHAVKPWLSAKLDFAPPVKDLGADAVLIGGRVDYLDGHPVAALVYRRRAHVIDVFVWPTQERDAAIRLFSERGFTVAHGVKAGMNHWAVSDINRDELSALLARQMALPENEGK